MTRLCDSRLSGTFAKVPDRSNSNIAVCEARGDCRVVPQHIIKNTMSGIPRNDRASGAAVIQ